MLDDLCRHLCCGQTDKGERERESVRRRKLFTVRSKHFLWYVLYCCSSGGTSHSEQAALRKVWRIKARMDGFLRLSTVVRLGGIVACALRKLRHKRLYLTTAQGSRQHPEHPAAVKRQDDEAEEEPPMRKHVDGGAKAEPI